MFLGLSIDLLNLQKLYIGIAIENALHCIGLCNYLLYFLVAFVFGYF